MLNALRKSATGWVAKTLIGLLVLSFAVWGVADIFTGYRGDDVAVVGETPITIQEYQAALQRQIQQTSQQVGQYLTMDQARAIGLDQQVLGRMMAEAALDDAARARGLNISDAIIADSIRQDPTFQAPGGQFDRAYFEQVLRASGYSEAVYVNEQRQALTRQMIAESIGGGIAPPTILEKAVDRFRNETRSAEFIVITPAMVDTLPEPSEEQLRSYFNDHVSEFRAPEYRKIGLISVQPLDLTSRVDIPEEDVRASYDANPDRFGTPERRTIERIVFDTSDEARQAYDEINGGKSFEAVADARGLNQDDRTLGTLTRDGVLDPAIAEAAFGLDLNQVSEPVQGTFGPVLVRVTEIDGGTSRSFDDVKAELQIDMALERAQDLVLDLYDAIEDDRAGGMTLAEAAAKEGLDYREIPAIDRQGNDTDGNRIGGIIDRARLMNEVYATDIGVEADPLQATGDGWIWYEVLDIIPERDKTFEEARDDVATAWRAEQTGDLVSDKAKAVVSAIESGDTFFKAAEDLGTTSGLVGPLRRTDTDDIFGQSAVQLLFTTPKDGVTSTIANVGDRRVVFRVTDVSVPDFDAQASEVFAAELGGGIANDILGQYLADLETRIGTVINPQAMAIALGERQPDQGH